MMNTYVEIGGNRYAAEVHVTSVDTDWDGRQSKTIDLNMAYGLAADLFVDDAEWAVVYETGGMDGEEPQTVTEDCSNYCVAGPITDNRDGTVTVRMGKPTDGELLAELLAVLNADEG